MRIVRGGPCGTSLVEIMTAVAVVVLLLTLLLEFTGSVTRAWDRERSRGERLRLGRNAMSLMAADLASICRSPHATNLAIGKGVADNDGCWLTALVTRPGNGCDVCAIGYHLQTSVAAGEARLVRSCLSAGATLEMLRSGSDPLRGAFLATDESLATGVRDLRFETIPRPPGSPSPSTAFVTNLPDTIEVSFSMAGSGRDDAIPFRCRLPLR